MNKLFERINSQALGNFTLVVYCLAFFIWTGGLMYSVWFGLFALVWRVKYEKQPLRVIPKGLFWWILLAFFMPIVSDLMNVVQTGNVSAFDKFSYLIMIFVAWEFITNKRKFHLLAALWAVSLFISLIGAMPSLMYWFKNPVSRVTSFYDIMRYGHMLGPAIVLLFGWFVFGTHEKKIKISLGLLLATSLVVLVGNGTRGVWLTVMPSLFCLSFFRPRYLLLLIALMAVMWFSAGDKYRARIEQRVVSAFNVSKSASHSNKLRMIFWQSAWMTFKQNPVFGTGTKGFEKYFVANIKKSSNSAYVNKYYPRNQNNAHNSYLTMLAKYGLLGALPLLLLLWIKIPYEVFCYLKKKGKLNTTLLCGFFGLYSFLVAAVTENSMTAKSGNTISVCVVLIFIALFQRFEDKVLKD